MTTAGTRVRAASRVTATAIASAGPIARKMPSELRISARNATITAPPAEAIASPARSSACDHGASRVLALRAAARGSGTGRTGCSRCRCRRARRTGSPRSTLSALRSKTSLAQAIRPVATGDDQADHDDRHQADDHAAEDQREQHHDQHDGRDADDGQRLLRWTPAGRALRRPAPVACTVEPGALDERLEVVAQVLDRRRTPGCRSRWTPSARPMTPIGDRAVLGRRSAGRRGPS